MLTSFWWFLLPQFCYAKECETIGVKVMGRRSCLIFLIMWVSGKLLFAAYATQAADDLSQSWERTLHCFAWVSFHFQWSFGRAVSSSSHWCHKLTESFGAFATLIIQKSCADYLERLRLPTNKKSTKEKWNRVGLDDLESQWKLWSHARENREKTLNLNLICDFMAIIE